MKVKHATTHELVNNLSAKRRHPYMHRSIVSRYDVTLTCIKTIVCRYDVTQECQQELAANQNRDSIGIV